MADLTTLANAKAWLSVSSATDDALLSRLISAASDYIQTWLNRDIAMATYTSIRDGNSGLRLMANNYPVSAVTSVIIDQQTIPASIAGGAGYVFDSTSIMLIGGYKFTRGFQNVTIQYVAGYAITPKEIEQAAIELVSMRYKERDRIGQVSKSIGGETVTFSQKDFSDSIETTLTNYKKVITL